MNVGQSVKAIIDNSYIGKIVRVIKENDGVHESQMLRRPHTFYRVHWKFNGNYDDSHKIRQKSFYDLHFGTELTKA